MTRSPTATIVGAGVFGVTAAIELRRRRFEVTLVDAGPVPHPDASSTDVSKAVRMDYGNDAFYSLLGQRSIERWREWNRTLGRPLYHEIGILMLGGRPFDQGGFEADCYEMLQGRGVPVERLGRAELGTRFPAWSASTYPDAYLNPHAGWAESGAVVARLKEEAVRLGATLSEGRRCERLIDEGCRVVGAVLDDGDELRSEVVVVAAGAWTPFLLPHLSGMLWATGQPVAHFRPPAPERFDGSRFPVWCADIANTGWYGFPLNADGVIKLGHHGPGRRFRQGDPQVTEPEEVERFRTFLDRTFPDAAGAPLVKTRLCLYCDSADGDFLIDHDPDRPGLVVAAGGSGHGFKFAPLLGEIIADVVERKPNPDAERFRWRAPGERVWEQARNRGDG